jgi:dihydropteroate synthase
MRRHFTLQWRGRRLALGHRTAVMGIVNVTPDSFSDGGRFLAADAAVAQAEKMAAEGADIIDIGGESTRPYADDVPAQAEMDRVLPVIETVAQRVDIPVSIDTTKATVAEAAVAAGASIINDIAALRLDEQMAAVAARHQVPLILMHMQGTPRTMQRNPVYADLIADVRRFMQYAMDQAVAAGVKRDHLIIDPGIGFGKTIDHNLTLLARLEAFADMNAPILVGASRKTFIRKILSKERPQELAPDSLAVEIGSQAAVAAAVLHGAHIVRVHNVANTRAMVDILDAVRHASE